MRAGAGLGMAIGGGAPKSGADKGVVPRIPAQRISCRSPVRGTSASVATRPKRSAPRASSTPSASVSNAARSAFERGARSERKSIDCERSHQTSTVSAASHSVSRT